GVALGLVLTGGYRPSPSVLAEIRRADLFAALVPEDTYSVASEVHDLLVKTHPADLEKIETIKALVAEHLDIDRILEVAAEPARRPPNAPWPPSAPDAGWAPQPGPRARGGRCARRAPTRRARGPSGRR